MGLKSKNPAKESHEDVVGKGEILHTFQVVCDSSSTNMVAANVVGSEKEQLRKAAKKAKKQAKKQAKRDNEAAAATDDMHKSKKRKSRDEEDTDPKSQKSKKHKESRKDGGETFDSKSKKEKKLKSSKQDPKEDSTSADEQAARKEKKRLKKEKKEREAAAALKATEEANSQEVKTKEKSSKKARQPEPVAKPAASADQWNPDALTGDAARKNKFLRLLGAGKGDGVEAAPKKKQASDQDIQRVESELERQFAAGIRMKHGGMGKRTGLGM